MSVGVSERDRERRSAASQAIAFDQHIQLQEWLAMLLWDLGAALFDLQLLPAWVGTELGQGVQSGWPLLSLREPRTLSMPHLLSHRVLGIGSEG